MSLPTLPLSFEFVALVLNVAVVLVAIFLWFVFKKRKMKPSKTTITAGDKVPRTVDAVPAAEEEPYVSQIREL